MAAHRYWRLRAPFGGYQASGTTYASAWQATIAEMEWRATSGGADELTGGTISASTVASGYSAAGAIDNVVAADTANEWQSNSEAYPTGPWIKYDFGVGNDKDIVEVVIKARAWFNGSEPGLFLLESSDDNSTWKPEWYGKATSAWSAGDVRTWTKSSDIDLTGGHRYWRLYVTGAGSGNNSTSFGAIALRTGAGLTDLAPLTLATASSVYPDGTSPSSDHQPSNTIDQTPEGGNGGDWDVATASSLPQWIAFDFGPGNAPNISHVTLTARSTFDGWLRAPREGEWQYSDDNSTWTASGTFSESAWSSGESRALTLTPVDSVGAATGTGGATGVSTSTAGAAGAAAGTGSAAGSNSSAFAGVGNSLGQGQAAGLSVPTTGGSGVAVGAGEAAGVASNLQEGAGTAAGTSTSAAVGSDAGTAIGAAAGTGEAFGAGAVLGYGIGSSDASGTSSAAASSSTYFSTAGYSESIAHVYGVGTGIIPAEGAVATFGAATGVGAPLTSGVGTSAGTGAATGASAGLENGAGAAAGTSDAVGVGGWDSASLGLAISTGAAAAVGSQVQEAVGAAAGTGAATGVGEGTPESAGASAGTGAAAAVGRVIASGAGVADGTSTVSGVMTAVQLAAAVSAAVGAAMAVGAFTATNPLVSTRIVAVRQDIRTQKLLPDDEWATPLA